MKRYEEILEKIAASIREGVYPLGTTLPSEPELAKRMGVSRSTIRNALSELQKLGLVTRRPSTGTRVEATDPRQTNAGYAYRIDSIEALIAYASAMPREILKIDDVVADNTLADLIGRPPGSRWIHIAHLRRTKEDPQATPFCWTDVYIDGRYSKIIRDNLQNHDGALSNLIETHAGRRVSEIEQIIDADFMPESLTGIFGVKPNSPALKIQRRYYFTPKELIQFSVSFYPAGRYAYTSRLVHDVGQR